MTNYVREAEYDYTGAASCPAHQESITGEDWCTEGRAQQAHGSNTLSSWSDTGTYTMDWPDYFDPIRSNTYNMTAETASFALASGETAAVKFTLKQKTGSGGFYRDDPSPDTIKWINRLFHTDIEFKGTIEITRPSPDTPGGGGSG